MHRASAITLVLSLCTACDMTDETTLVVTRALVENHAAAISWAIAWRTALGGGLGLLLGLAALFGLRAAGALRWDWRHARWVRVLAGVAVVLGFAGAGAGLGFWQGTLRGAQTLIGEGQLASEVLPVVGDAGSAMLAGLYVGGELVCEDGQPLAAAQTEQLGTRLGAYVEGEWQMQPEQLRARLGATQRCTIEVASDEAQRWVFARYPQLETNLGEVMVPWLLDQVARQLLAQALESESVGVYAQPIVDMLARLDEAAAREGDPSQLSHAELSGHVVSTALVPLILLPIEHAVISQRQVCVAVPIGLLVLVVGGFALGRRYDRRRVAA